MSEKLITCSHCRSQIPFGANVCKGCRAEIQYGTPPIVFLVLLVLSAVMTYFPMKYLHVEFSLSDSVLNWSWGILTAIVFGVLAYCVNKLLCDRIEFTRQKNK